VAWVGATVGLSMPNPETASTAGLIWLFPLTFLSNAFVPLSSMPAWLQTFAAFNPVSTLVLACRELFGNPTGIQPDYWSLQNPVLYTLISCAVVIAIFATLSIRKFSKTTSA
jgi:ABC-type multidrug transport system permease subunit